MKKRNNDYSQQLQQRGPDALKKEQEERVIVTPVDRLAPQEQQESPQVDKTTKPHVDKPTNPHVDKPTSPQIHKSIKPQKDKSTSGQTHKPTNPQVEKYTTHLRPDTIKAIKRYAVDHDRKDYEVVQEALDRFIK